VLSKTGSEALTNNHKERAHGKICDNDPDKHSKTMGLGNSLQEQTNAMRHHL
jgi:hypothetical protein